MRSTASHEVLLVPSVKLVNGVEDRLADLYEARADAGRPPVPQCAEANFATVSIGDFSGRKIPVCTHDHLPTTSVLRRQS